MTILTCLIYLTFLTCLTYSLFQGGKGKGWKGFYC